MLKDRRLLLEQEIKKAREEAAAIYLDIVTHDLDVHNDKYEFIKNKKTNHFFLVSLYNS